ncbi:MAG: ABC transporter ATP-binding protein [Elusimicrobiales bacterium]|nr:ABC transporter ATP-binding protein [Elusimicrobiales bacterium]
MEKQTILDIKGLNKAYKQGREEIKVLENLDFRIRRGEFVSIVGPSGSGKSTLLNIIGLLDNEYSGKVSLFGEDMGKADELRKAVLRLKHLGFVFQFDSLLPEFTVKENIEMPAMLLSQKKAKEENSAKKEEKDNNASGTPSAAELLKRFNLEEIADKFPMEISGGEKQRSAMMRALRNGPELLIADEPTGNLDPNNSDLIMKDLRRIADGGTAVIMVTHNEKSAFEADSVLRMENGRLAEAEKR